MGYGGGRGGKEGKGEKGEKGGKKGEKGEKGGKKGEKGGKKGEKGKGGKGKGGKKGGGLGGKGRPQKTDAEKAAESGLDNVQPARWMATVQSPHVTLDLTKKVVKMLAISLKRTDKDDGKGAQTGPDSLGLKESDPKWLALMQQVLSQLRMQLKGEAVDDALCPAGNCVYVNNAALLPKAEFEPFEVKVRFGRDKRTYMVQLKKEKDVELALGDEATQLAVQTMTHNIVSKVLRQKYTMVDPVTKKLLHTGEQRKDLTIMKGVKPRVEMMMTPDAPGPGLYIELEPVVKITSQEKLTHVYSKLKAEGSDWDLFGCTVLTPHNNCMYKFRKVVSERAGQKTFKHRGNDVTIQEYFKSRHNIAVPANDPVFEVRNDEGRYCMLPGSVCCTSYLTLDQRQQLPGVCSLQPSERHRLVDEALKYLSEARDELQEWGITAGNALLRHRATRLEPVKLAVGGKQAAVITADFGRDLAKFSYGQGGSATFDALVSCSHKPGLDRSSNRFDKIQQELGKVKAPYKAGTIRTVAPEKHRWDDAFQSVSPSPGTVVFTQLPDGNKDDYAKIKTSCVKNGWVSQCQNTGKTENSKGIGIITANFAKQICHKKGLLSWWVPLEQSVPALAKKTVMFVGIDVNRTDAELNALGGGGGKVAKTLKGFVGFVAWLYDPSEVGARRWKHYCDWTWKSHKETIYLGDDSASESVAPSESGMTTKADTNIELFASSGTKIRDFLTEAGKHFIKEKKGRKIDRVIVMRDGGSFGNYDLIQELEAEQAADAAENREAWGGVKPDTTFLMLNKRPSTRFWGDNETCSKLGVGAEKGGAYNVPRGVVVEGWSEMASAQHGMPTFWLVPHACNLSTTIPVKYTVVVHENEDALPLRDVQKLCFDLGYMYPNWPDAVKVPFPVQCAKKMADLHGKVTNPSITIHPEVRKGPFYL